MPEEGHIFFMIQTHLKEQYHGVFAQNFFSGGNAP